MPATAAGAGQAISGGTIIVLHDQQDEKQELREAGSRMLGRRPDG
jgi:hypothetical protein